MNYPTRSKSHVTEALSRTLVHMSLPRAWIIRDVGERDYGIDMYVEIVGPDQRVSGNMVALQIKGKNLLKFDGKNKSASTVVKMSTINYWLALPVPVFLCVACIESKRCFWVNIQARARSGAFQKSQKTASIAIPERDELSAQTIEHFQREYSRERCWGRIENAIEKGLMLFNTLGPLLLMVKRANGRQQCSTTIQYLVNQHYEYYFLLCKYLLGKSAIPLRRWYEESDRLAKDEGRISASTMYNDVLYGMFNTIVSNYRNGLIAAYELVTVSQAEYFSKKFPYLSSHLAARPHTFLADDWFPRFYFDEYEEETTNPEALYFQDFADFDNILNDISPS